MPSRLTLVPGSQGPRHSGSVASAASAVFTATERVRTMICSQGDEMSLLVMGARRWRGGGAGVETGDSICWRDREERLTDLGTLRGRRLWTREQNAQQPERRRTRLLSLSYTPETFIHLIHIHHSFIHLIQCAGIRGAVISSSGQQKHQTKISSPRKAPRPSRFEKTVCTFQTCMP